MDKELPCDFYLGDTLGNSIKLMQYQSLSGYKATLRNIHLTSRRFLWQKGILNLIFKPYKHYIITGSPGCLSNWVLLLLALPMGKKVYAWTHGMKGDKKGKGKLFEKTFFKLCYRVLLYGNYSRNIMLQEGFKGEKLVTIYNSLNHRLQLAIREKMEPTEIYHNHFNSHYPVIVYTGRIQKSKKLEMLVLAVRELKNQGLDCNLVFVGDDLENGYLQNLVEKQSLQAQTWFYGPCYNEKELAQLLYNATVCVSPGPIGLTAVHALTYGCPVITNNDYKNQMPEHEAIIPGMTGDFFGDNDVRDLVRVINKWLIQSPELRSKIRKAAYEVIDTKWNPQNQLKVIKNVLGE